MTSFQILDANPQHLEALLELNESEIPHVSTLSRGRLKELLALSASCRVAEDPDTGAIAGFLLAFDETAEYDSLNFLWFKKRYPRFIYVDRIAVAAAFRGQGVGRALYQDLRDRFAGAAPLLTCEVNVRPPNPGSLEFHRKMGFVEVGRQDTEGGKKTVALLSAPL